MRYIRILLLILSAAACAAFALMAKYEARTFEDGAVMLAIAAVCALNWYYLLEMAPAPRSRLFRMAALWLDAKEGDLKRRATQPD